MDVPGVILTATICAYWFGAGMMIVRVRRLTRHVADVVPTQPLERMMGLLWIPVVAAWVVLPWLALTTAQAPFALPSFARGVAAYEGLRWLAALVGVACLAGTIKCWVRMGDDWRMVVREGERQAFITDGLFRRVRHPIYALSILLMLCTVAVAPTVPLMAVAAVHIGLMLVKARNEERHMLATVGEPYARYMAATGRFVPKR